MVTCKVASVIATGCIAFVKPARQVPFIVLAIAELSLRAGLPDGVFSVVIDSVSAIGDELTTYLIGRKVSFAGSTDIGRKASFIVCDNVDVDEVMSRVGRPIVYNICALGTLIVITQILDPKAVTDVLEQRIPKDFLDINMLAFDLGLVLGSQHQYCRFC
ncbi:Aldehyde dehydrogenase family protein [Desulforhopalus singaporensis]|uniref:Aldehyde dehydrogenase family protein n=2 Tax=Desulforhopalus singaporensis TaxID=91360 RepID=A0A1H0VMY6_9BACT|nr:Aldehyde dehydrogenase family protein [Desulforhopalus singaporensis]